MPRAFLIKSKKERKKLEEGDEERERNQEQLQCLQESPETPLASTEKSSHISHSPTAEQQTEVENAVKIQAEENAEAVSEQNLPSPIPRGKTKAKKALKEVQICEQPQSKKARKRAPKRSPIYYYSDENDGPSSESERNTRCVDRQRVPSSIPSAPNFHSSSSAVKCNGTSEVERETYCSPRQNEQSRCQENSRQFEFQTNTAHELPREENKPRFARITDDKENQINEGLDNVKILEYHSISSNIEVVYPDVPKPLQSRATENRTAEKFYPVQSSPAVQAPQSAEVSQNATAVATQAPVATQPVIHYVPVFAVQGPNGVYYEPVPGAPHVVQNGPPAPYPSPQPGHPQAVQRVPEQSVPPQQPPPQQFAPHQMMPPAQARQVSPQQVPQPQPQPQPMQSPGAVMHHQQLPPQQPGTPPYPVPQPYNPPTYPQQPQAVTYSAESPSYAKPVQVTPGMPYPPSSQVAMTTKPYPVPAMAQVQAPVPQHYVAQPPSAHAVMQYPQYPPSSQAAAVPQGYQTQERPPASQGQVLHHYAQMPNQPQPRLPVQPGVAPQPYPVQQCRQPSPAYQPPQASPPYPHAAPVVVMQQPYPGNKTSPVPTAPYPAASRPPMQYAQPTNQPYTSQASYYPPKTVPSQPHPATATAAPAVAYPENRGMAAAHYMPREGEPKFVYAPPPVNFHQSPVYRVPEQGKGAEPAAMPVLSSNPSHDKAVSGSKRRKASVPHRGMRDIPSPPDSCGEQASPRGGTEKGDCHSPLNKSSCIITPPGSPHDKEQSDNGDTYTVVVHDRGIQTRPPEMEPRWCPTKRLWKMEPKRHPSLVQQEQPLVESAQGIKVEVPLSDDESLSLSPSQFSPTQKENMYLPDENSMNTQRPHGMRRGKGRKSSSRYHCKFCSKGFQWHSHLTSHERTHTGEKPYQCTECSRAFTRADGLQCHMIVHNKKKPFKCQYCAKGFSDNTLLEKHVYSHTGVKPFKCEYCGRAFTDSHSIEKHLLVHTGTKPFKCQYCVRSFNDSQMLVRHIRSHTGEKPYKCHHCPMAFSKQSALVIHTRVHTGEKPYKCPNCPKSFSISGNLQRHILIHTGERPYKCSKCPKAFNNPSHLSRHISKLHAPKVLEKNCVAVPVEADTIQVEMTH